MGQQEASSWLSVFMSSELQVKGPIPQDGITVAHQYEKIFFCTLSVPPSRPTCWSYHYSILHAEFSFVDGERFFPFRPCEASYRYRCYSQAKPSPRQSSPRPSHSLLPAAFNAPAISWHLLKVRLAQNLRNKFSIHSYTKAMPMSLNTFESFRDRHD
jgi:hypothetical protein